MSKHTPGPWISVQRIGEVRSFRRIISCDGMVVVADVPEDKSTTEKVRFANAHLISAAPDLLEALQQLTVTATRYLPEYNENPLIQQAEAALAKAQGEQK